MTIPVFLAAVMAFSFIACENSSPYIGDNCNWWVGGNDTGVHAGHKDFDGIICKACGNIEGMTAIKGGTFNMGQDDISNSTPVRSVTVNDFKMAKYPVTNELYFTVTGSFFNDFSGTPAAGEIQGKRPVENVSWNDAVDFCNKLSMRGGLTPVYARTGTTVTANWNANGYRLPTEAEWEYACRADTAWQWIFGDVLIYSSIIGGGTYANIDNYVWCLGNAAGKTHQVGLKLPNAFGLYDMHGNVFEWCWDWFDAAYYGESGNTNNPKGPDEGTYRVRRGGGWASSTNDTRSAYRSYSTPGSKSEDIGFRLVRR